MASLSAKLRSSVDGGILFWCPGCDGAHQVMVGEGSGPRWGYNGDPDKPTFTPSVLVTGKKITRDQSGKWDGDWERDASGNAITFVCHSFVTDGRIQFLNDCTHDMAGQTVDLPDFD